MDKRATARFLGVGVRTVERLQNTGVLVPAYVSGRGGLKADYPEDQVQAVKAERAQTAAESSPTPAKPRHAIERRGLADLAGLLTAGQDKQAAALGELARALEQLATALARPALTPAPAHGEGQASLTPMVPIADKVLLSLPECALLTGFPKGYLRKQTGKRGLKGRRVGGKWRVKRTDLDRFVSRL